MGTISGRVTTAAMPADTAAVQIDQAICGKTQPDASLVRSADGGVAWAVVLITGASAPASTPPSVTNRKCRFDPHVQVASPGQTLTMDSEDQTLHTTHAYGEKDRSLFNIAIPMPGLKITRPLERDSVVRLACDTHPWMRGYVVVSNELSAVSDERGAFTIANVPPGIRELRIWHERLKAAPQKVTVSAGATTEVTFTLTQ